MLPGSLVAFFLLSTAQFITCNRFNHLDTIFQWELFEYGFPTNQDRETAIANGNLVPSNGIPIDVQAHYNRRGDLRVFTTVPRFASGIPYTLATVSQHRPVPGTKGPLLQPYPSYEWHNSAGEDCDKITSAFRVAVTPRGDMWVLDSGNIAGVQLCPPQLLLFDLSSDQLQHRYRFDSSLYTANASLLITPVVVCRDPPPRGSCQQTMIYVADVTYHGLVIYDYQQNIGWRAEHKSMYPDPDYGIHTVAGESFELMDGIFGMSTDKRMLYYHPLASVKEYAVPLSVLDNHDTWAQNEEAVPQEFRTLGKRNSECGAEDIDSHGILYCVTLNPIKLLSWKVNTPYKAKNLREIPADPRLLEFVSGMKVVRNPAGKEELWLMSNRFQKLAAGTQSPDEVNFRILRLGLDKIQKNSDADRLLSLFV